MRIDFNRICVCLCVLASCFLLPIMNAEPSAAKLKTLYNHLDPLSISKHLAFYELFAPSDLGRQALNDACQLLMGKNSSQNFKCVPPVTISLKTIEKLVSMINKPIGSELEILNEIEIKALSIFSSRLKHNALKGHHVWSEAEVLQLPIEEIDLARGLFLSQFEGDKQRIQSYEALIDLMALQILANLSQKESPEDKIAAMNAFIFDEMGFRFPPHSEHIKGIDRYTFLPTVLDSHRGVCLGVSILYLCIAQRLGISLEMITPPGHIYVRYCSENIVINIETTARGVNIDSESYLGITTRSLQKRTIKEVIGMAHFNQASVYWQHEDYAQALMAYQKAEPYMFEDPLLKELMGYAYLLVGNQSHGERLLREVENHFPDYAVVKGTTITEYFNGEVDVEGIKALFMHVEEDRQSKLEKKRALEKLVERFARFKSGLLSLAFCWIELHRLGEALKILNLYQALDAQNPEVNFYLAILHLNRFNYPKAWYHLHQTEHTLADRHHYPKTLKDLRRELLMHCPE